jgi:hypothetical protein
MAGGSGGSGNLIPSPSPIGQIPLDVTEAPHPYGNVAGEMARTGEEMGRGLKEAGAGLMDLATPLAEAQASSALQNQKVTVGPDGKIQVLNPAHSFAFGAAGDAAARVIQAGTVSQAGASVDTALTDIHMKHLGDPAGQAAANDAFVSGLKGLTGNPMIDAAVMNRARDTGAQHLDHNTEYTTQLGVANSEKSLNAQREDVEQQLETLAQSGVGAGDSNYDKLMDQRKAIQEQFASSNILKEPPEVVAMRDKEFGTRLQGYHLISGLDAIVKDKNIFEAQKALDAFTKEHPELSRQDAMRLRADGMAHLEQYRPQAEADITSSHESAAALLKGFAAGKDKGQDASQFKESALGALMNARKVGDFWGASQLEGALNFAGIPFPALKDDGSGSTIKNNAPASTSPKVTASPLPPPGSPAGSYMGKTASGQSIVIGPDGHPLQTQPASPAAPAAGGAPVSSPAAATVQPAAATGPVAAPPSSNSFMDRVAQIESANSNIFSGTDPDVAGPGTKSQGYWQINTPTWRDFASAAGVDVSKYPNAMSAPRDVQEKVASVIPLGRFGPRTQTMLRQEYGPLDRHSTLGRLAEIHGGPSAAPVNGNPPHSAAELAANPYLNSAIIRSMMEDKGDRKGSISAIADMTENLAKVGISSPTEQIGAVLQFAQNNPTDESAQNIAAKVMGTQLALAATSGGSMAAGGGGGGPAAASGGVSNREVVEKEIRDWAAGPDILHKQAAAVAMEREIEFDKFAKEHPYLHAANAGIIKGSAPMIDAGNPQNIPAAIAQRAGQADFIGKMRGTQAPSLLGESGDGDALKSAFAGPNGADVIRGIGQLKPEVLSSLASEPAFREGLTAMSHSTDPEKLNAAYGVMDKLARQNPLDFNAKFKDGIKDLNDWQKIISTLPPDQVEKRMQQYNDPNERQAFTKAAEIANDALKNVSADSVVSKFSTGSFWPFGTGAQPPVGEPGRVDAKLALKADYDDAYKDAFSQNSNASVADDTAMKTISAKWGMSGVNGNRVMPYPPEQAYRNKDGSPMMVNGSMDWMKQQLDADILKAVGDTGGARPGYASPISGPTLTEAQNEAIQKASAPRALVSDATTQADIASGKPASYKVVIQNKDGRFSILSDAASGKDLRVRFDPSMAQADQIEQAERARAAPQAAPQYSAPFNSGTLP